MQNNRKRKRYSAMAEINVVPYIDVMLVLLVIFMITAPLLTQGVQVNLPKVATAALPQKQAEPIVLSIDSRGNYYLNIASNPHQIIDPETMQKQVASAISASKNSTGRERQVFVKGDGSVGYGKVVEAMVLLKKAGAGQVGLVTDPTRTSSRS
ncbi:MAG: protein TolR [Gammaproteobacteria bacterium]|jgi:biopolymer transport protein TolR